MHATPPSPRTSLSSLLGRALEGLTPDLGPLDLRVSEGELREDLDLGRLAATLPVGGKAGAVR